MPFPLLLSILTCDSMTSIAAVANVYPRVNKAGKNSQDAEDGTAKKDGSGKPEGFMEPLSVSDFLLGEVHTLMFESWMVRNPLSCSQKQS